MKRIIDGYIKDEPLHHLCITAGKSVESAIHETVITIEESLNAKRFTISAFLDIEGAFNEVSFSSIMRAASEFKICCEQMD